jgi:hypothetical protein
MRLTLMLLLYFLRCPPGPLVSVVLGRLLVPANAVNQRFALPARALLMTQPCLDAEHSSHHCLHLPLHASLLGLQREGNEVDPLELFVEFSLVWRGGVRRG